MKGDGASGEGESWVEGHGPRKKRMRTQHQVCLTLRPRPLQESLPQPRGARGPCAGLPSPEIGSSMQTTSAGRSRWLSVSPVTTSHSTPGPESPSLSPLNPTHRPGSALCPQFAGAANREGNGFNGGGRGTCLIVRMLTVSSSSNQGFWEFKKTPSQKMSEKAFLFFFLTKPERQERDTFGSHH